ncbi:hypothetical protein EYF80_064896 [Liparis tanakae]|uniref:Uncharacterized protein n=1 Tax=Liparis tanakae TaxID=230148 RepID=A0A4Z2E851_9TELE|nr:hypothetical protein EYF80_064896 [Liparis tanakae]
MQSWFGFELERKRRLGSARLGSCGLVWSGGSASTRRLVRTRSDRMAGWRQGKRAPDKKCDRRATRYVTAVGGA